METQKQQETNPSTTAFFALVNHPLKFRLYLLKNLPAAFFCSVKMVQANPQECVVSVPYKWFTKNPFRSTYFACLSMAAELSTGVLAMAAVYGRRPSVSMLVTGMEAKFYKKAKDSVYFRCEDGEKVAAAIEAAIATGSAQEIRLHSEGINSAGEPVAAFWVTWSFKVR